MAQEHAAAVVGESGFLRSTVLFCVFPLSVSLLLLFPLFAVMLNYPYPDPSGFFCLFLSILLQEGRLHGAFVAGRRQTITLFLDKFCKSIM